MRRIKTFRLFEDIDPNRITNFLDSIKDAPAPSRNTSTGNLRSTLIDYYKNRTNWTKKQSTYSPDGSYDSPSVISTGNTTPTNSVTTPRKNVDTPTAGEVKIGRIGGTKEQNAKIVVDALKKYGIVNPLTQKAILSVIGKESNFIPKDEIPYRNTSNERIRKIFGSRVAGLSDAELTALKKDDVAFWDKVYGGRYGNDRPGDGARYLGRGFNGLTFKGNYEKYDKLLRNNGTNVNIVANPEMVNDPKIAAEVNALYFVNGLSSKHSKRKFGNDDPNDFTDFDKALGAAVNANAGWGNNIAGSRAYRNALAYSSKFDIEDYSNLA